MNFVNKVVVITGASRVIGSAIVKAFKERGAIVYAPSSKACDVRDCVSIEAFKKTIKQKRVDVLVNNAGVDVEKSFEETTVKEFEYLIDVNYLGSVRMIKSLFSFMHNSSHIVNIGSMVGLHGKANMVAYSGSKFALTGFSEAIRQEYRRNINVSLVCPSAVDTGTGYRGRTISVETVVGMVFRGIEKKQFLVLPNLEKLLVYKIKGLNGDFITW